MHKPQLPSDKMEASLQGTMEAFEKSNESHRPGYWHGVRDAMAMATGIAQNDRYSGLTDIFRAIWDRIEKDRFGGESGADNVS